MKYLAKLRQCIGHPNQYGDCEKCGKKVNYQTFALEIYKPCRNLKTDNIGRIQVSSTYGHENCLNEIVKKYNAEIIN